MMSELSNLVSWLHMRTFLLALEAYHEPAWAFNLSGDDILILRQSRGTRRGLRQQ